MSSESELTEVSSEDYDMPSSQEAGRKRKVKSPSGYAIKDALKQPSTASLLRFTEQMKTGDIKVDPEYQRNVVKMSFYFKQADSTKAVRLLPEPLRKQFRNKTLVCIEYRELSPVHEREMFQRVQLGMALTTGEQLQSFDGPMAQFVHRIHNELFDKAHIGTSMNLAIERGRGFQNLVQTIACVARLPDYAHASYVQQTRLLQCQGMAPEKIKEIQTHSERALRLLGNIASDPQLCAVAFSLPPRTTRNSPVEFCFSTLLIAMRMDEPGVGKAELAQAIGTMRAAMRAKHADMRSNSSVSMSFWNYLNQHQDSSQPGPSTQVIATPAVKKLRVKHPLTPETPTKAHHSESPTIPQSQLKSASRSESSTRFHGIFSSNSSSQQPSNVFHPSTPGVKPPGMM
ncbi:hypothetical protein FRC10_011274 [Ceratobasidium sp. 414]|nr:hypothetical protein FRC10_011274 [Ceratobasidium sp. 414]